MGFAGQNRRQQHAIIGQPRLVADHGDGVAPSASLDNSSTRRAAAIPLPTMTRGSLTACPSYRCFFASLDPDAGRGRSPCTSSQTRASARLGTPDFRRAPAQIEPPGDGKAGRVERQIDFQRELRTAGDGDRLAEATRDQIAATGADRADEAERCAALDAGGLQGQRPAGVAVAAAPYANSPRGRSRGSSGRSIRCRCRW